MPRNLVTGFKKLATAGPTVDGREIKEQDLLDIAEQYDPDNEYSALIWPEHFRYMNLGRVREVKVQKDSKGRPSLYGRLAPNDMALRYNKEAQLLYPSIEITANYANTGKAYLTGLAFTDSPASVGTQELRFSKIKKTDAEIFCFDEPIHDLSDSNDSSLSADDQAAMEGFFTKLAKSFGLQSSSNLCPNTPNSTSEQETDEMTEEQFKQLMEAQTAQTEAFSKLAEAVTPQSDADPAADPDPVPAKEGETTGISQEQFNKLLEATTAQAESFNKLNQTITDAFSEQPPTPTPQGEGPNTGKKLL